LTESTYFAGRLGFLEAMAFSGKPLLRKDFIFDPLQILETAETPASAVLLIVRLTPDAVLLKELKDTAEEYGLAPVVEIHDSDELELARRVGAKLIQFNSRDLRGLSVDPERIFDLAIREPPGPGELYVAASGLSTVRDLAEVEAAGFGAALMGTAFMRAQDPGLALGGLLDEFAAWRQKGD
jgi:indole-3-glycerol phosphate synthase